MAACRRTIARPRASTSLPPTRETRSAQNNLGVFYEQGRGGLPKDEREAARLYKLAADQGNARAQANLGLFYSEGRGGLPKDDREAARLFKLAADQGDAGGRGDLGFFYSEGRGGLPKDEREAARLYKLAAEQGNAFGQVNLGVFYEQDRSGLLGFFYSRWPWWPAEGRSRGRAPLQARRRAGKRFRASQSRVFYEHGRGGLPKDDREAARLYKLAADQGNARAQAALTRLGRQQQQEEQQRREGSCRARAPKRQEEQDRKKQEEQEAAARERQRRQEEQDRRRHAASGKMSAAQALEILGLKAGATEQEIRAAYNRLMKRVHPDVGGSDFFAKQLNDARDVLLGQRAR